MEGHSTTPAAAEDAKRRAAMARRTTAAFGQVMALVMRSPGHQRMTVAEIRMVIAPIVLTGQFALAGRRSADGGFPRPIAAVLWASVSAETDARLMAAGASNFALKRDEISNGDIIWIVDVLGDGIAVKTLIDELGSTRWQGRTVRARALGPETTVEVTTLGPFAAAL